MKFAPLFLIFFLEQLKMSLVEAMYGHMAVPQFEASEFGCNGGNCHAPSASQPPPLPPAVDGEAVGGARRGEGGGQDSGLWSWKSPVTGMNWSQGPDGRVHTQQWTSGKEQLTLVEKSKGLGVSGGGMQSFETLPPPSTATITQPLDTPRPFGWLSEEARQTLIKTCASGRVNCRSQDYDVGKSRQMLLHQESQFMTKALGAKTAAGENSGGQQMAAQRLDMTFQLKQKMIKAAGLAEHIEAVNDGTFEHDVLLTEKQSSALMDALDQQMPSTLSPAPVLVVPSVHQSQPLVPLSTADDRQRPVVHGASRYGGGYGGNNNGQTFGYGRVGGRKRRGLSLILEQLPAQRWDVSTPIPYYFDPTVAEFEREMVRQAHRMIQDGTCIRFQIVDEKPSTGPYIYYIKVASPAFCGLSYIGRVEPANPVYLSFACQDPVGVAAHETMHALGAQHEHLRVDRDSYIDIQWENVNPQFYDFFAIADPAKFTPYGIPYDYGSIMHYNAFTAAIDRSKPTMDPRNDPQTNRPLMGQRKRLSNSDVQLLNTMYCSAQATASDVNAFCGIWALRGFCATNSWMQQNCQKSCASKQSLAESNFW